MNSNSEYDYDIKYGSLCDRKCYTIMRCKASGEEFNAHMYALHFYNLYGQ